MKVDEAYRELAQALRVAETRAEKAERELADLRARLEHLVTVLIGKQELAEGNRDGMARAGEAAARKVESRVRLRMYADKYQITGADIDCMAKIPICKARCCSLTFELSLQDLEEGVVMWEVTRPYLIRHERDGHCSHVDRATGGCTIHAQRPAVCRHYDCRQDPRIWLDFEQNLPAPFPPELSPMPIGSAEPKESE